MISIVAITFIVQLKLLLFSSLSTESTIQYVLRKRINVVLAL